MESLQTLTLHRANTDARLYIPLVGATLSAGFPSPADDFLDTHIDLNRELIRHPAATFYGRVKGDSLKDLGINEGDILVVDRSLKPSTGKLAVCCLNGEFTVKTLRFNAGIWLLEPANPKYPVIPVHEDSDFLVWGIVTYAIKNCLK